MFSKESPRTALSTATSRGGTGRSALRVMAQGSPPTQMSRLCPQIINLDPVIEILTEDKEKLAFPVIKYNSNNRKTRGKTKSLLCARSKCSVLTFNLHCKSKDVTILKSILQMEKPRFTEVKECAHGDTASRWQN